MNSRLSSMAVILFAVVMLFVATVRAADDGGSSKPASKTELAKLAAGMKPGTWAELKTAEYNLDLLKVQNHHTLEYTDTAVWDPKSQ